MNDVAIVLQVLIKIHLHAVTIAREIVTRQVYQHYMLRILFRIVAQVFCVLLVLVRITRTTSRSCDGVDVGLIRGNASPRRESASGGFYAAVCLGRRTEDAESSEIEIEEIRRRIDAAQGTIELKVIALVLLHETTREHYLEHIAT